MAQWGMTRKFILPHDTSIKILAHVYTGENPFAPIVKDSKIDQLLLMHVWGDKQIAERTFRDLCSYWLGRPHAEWESDEHKEHA